jgi:hypothetical protein
LYYDELLWGAECPIPEKRKLRLRLAAVLLLSICFFANRGDFVGQVVNLRRIGNPPAAIAQIVPGRLRLAAMRGTVENLAATTTGDWQSPLFGYGRKLRKAD